MFYLHQFTAYVCDFPVLWLYLNIFLQVFCLLILFVLFLLIIIRDLSISLVLQFMIMKYETNYTINFFIFHQTSRHLKIYITWRIKINYRISLELTAKCFQLCRSFSSKFSWQLVVIDSFGGCGLVSKVQIIRSSLHK